MLFILPSENHLSIFSGEFCFKYLLPVLAAALFFFFLQVRFTDCFHLLSVNSYCNVLVCFALILHPLSFAQSPVKTGERHT